MENCLKTLRTISAFVLFMLITSALFSQVENKDIRRGNKYYKQGNYDKSIPEYRKALEKNPENPKANYNLGNAEFRNEKWPDASTAFDKAFSSTNENGFKEKAVYNKGVSFSKQKKLLESIDAYKTALKLKPDDADARHNLQKALLELKKQNQSNDQKQNKEQKKEQKQQQKKQEKPKEQQSKFNKRQVEQLMKALRQKEQEIQQKMQQNKSRASSQPDKDW
jgi:tetratricopeptide (TPR) repeat protein